MIGLCLNVYLCLLGKNIFPETFIFQRFLACAFTILGKGCQRLPYKDTRWDGNRERAWGLSRQMISKSSNVDGLNGGCACHGLLVECALSSCIDEVPLDGPHQSRWLILDWSNHHRDYFKGGYSWESPDWWLLLVDLPLLGIYFTWFLGEG